MRYLAFCLLAVVSLVSCSKDDPTAGKLTLAFTNKVGSQPLVPETGQYTNAAGEAFTVSTLNYFISNIRLKKDDGSTVSFPGQYFLIRQADSLSRKAIVEQVPFGSYSSVTFTIGVDSARSVSPVSERKGVLDEASYGDDSMYWAWNTGYVFLKLEGTSPVVDLNSAGQRKYMYHIGGFGGMTGTTANNLRQVTLPLAKAATVTASATPSIGITADLQKLFNGKTLLKLKDLSTIHSPAAGTVVADNFPSMFSVQ
jgi:hypothetical protein